MSLPAPPGVKKDLKDVAAAAMAALSFIGFTRREAFDTTRALLYGEMRGGKRNHGLERLAWLKEQRGKSFETGRGIKRVSGPDAAGRLILDGQGGVGYAQMYAAVRCASDLLKTSACMSVGLRHSYPTNCLGDPAGLLAKQGHYSYAATVSPPRVAMPGGRLKLLSTSGQAMAFPTDPLFVLDFGIGSLTNGDLMGYLQSGATLPAGACVRADGVPAVRASEVIDAKGHLSGAILPRGGHDSSAIFAGFGMTMLFSGMECGLTAGEHGSFLMARRVPLAVQSAMSSFSRDLIAREPGGAFPGVRGRERALTVMNAGEITLPASVWSVLGDFAGRGSDSVLAQELLGQLRDEVYRNIGEDYEIT